MTRAWSALACSHLLWLFSAASVTDDVSVDDNGECAVLRKVCVSDGALHMRTANAANAARNVLRRAVSDVPYYGEQSIPAPRVITEANISNSSICEKPYPSFLSEIGNSILLR